MRRTLDSLPFTIAWMGLLMLGSQETAGERQITKAPYGHILTNVGVWSPDGQWIVYDVRSDPAGGIFDGTRIEAVHVDTGEVRILYESTHGAHCGVATYCGQKNQVVFIHGPEDPGDGWQYSAYHRRGVVVSATRPRGALNLDARNVKTPFTPGALRGGTHVHTSSGDGTWVAFTYEDHVLASLDSETSLERETSPERETSAADHNQRNVGVSVPVGKVIVPPSHPRNHDGSHFSVLVTRTVNEPRAGSDEISRAFSDAWIGRDGYLRPDGRRQKKAIAFQGQVRTSQGTTISEVFVVDIPDDVTIRMDAGPLEGTSTRRPLPPLGTVQRRLTFTGDRKFPGVQGVRHWLRSSPDGSQVAFLMKDSEGVSQLWTISPNGGPPRQVTDNEHDISSAFSWSPDGKSVAHTMNESVCVTLVEAGKTIRLTKPNVRLPLRPEACVISPDGQQIAYVRQVTSQGDTQNQIFVTSSYRSPMPR